MHRINKALDENGWPTLDYGRITTLASKMDISVNSARKWLIGQATPEQWRIKKLAQVIGTTEEYLVQGNGPIRRASKPAFITLPIISQGKVTQFIDGRIEVAMCKKAVVPNVERYLESSGFVMEVTDESMAPTLRPGDRVVIDAGRKKKPAPNQVVLVQRAHDEMPVLRRYKPTEEFEGGVCSARLEPDNNAYPVRSIEPDDEIIILAPVVQAHRYNL